jgi:hypothetical protein
MTSDLLAATTALALALDGIPLQVGMERKDATVHFDFLPLLS